MSNPQTGRGRKVKKISLGTLMFWGFIGWLWFGDTITGFFHTNVEIKVQDEKIEVDLDKTLDTLKTKIDNVKNEITKEVEKKKEKTNPDEGKVMTAEKNEKDKFSSDDKYGDYDKY